MLVWVSQVPLRAQCPMDWLMKQSEFNVQIMRKQLSKFLLILILLFQLTGYQTIAQSETAINKPPTLENGQKLGNYLRLGYREVNDQFIVISVTFKITANGFLDTLSISENAPESFIKAATKQLTAQNGHWNPQLVNGKPVKSKWLIARFYIGGFREESSDCIDKLQHGFLEAYKREQELFLCDKKLEPPLKCLIDYVEGYNCYLYPPLLSNTVR